MMTTSGCRRSVLDRSFDLSDVAPLVTGGSTAIDWFGTAHGLRRTVPSVTVPEKVTDLDS